MTFTPEQFELIVQRVIQQLGTTGAAIAPAPARESARLAPATDPAAAPGIRIAGQVITQELLAASATGTSLVRIAGKAILTPSARDFVKQHGIKIVREDASSSGAAATIRWQVLVTKSTPQISAAIDGLSGIVCDIRLLGAAAEAAAQAISALCRGEAHQVVVFTEQPELVACLANRNETVRAAAVAETADVERVRLHLQANLLALDPATRSVHELRSILKAFRAP
jgi:hypothetical protein